MSTAASKRIDQTYAKLSPGIREIILEARAIIHKADPSIQETWKWGPAFEKNGLVLGLWGFKKHVSAVFYRGAEMSDKHKLFNAGLDNAKIRMIKFTSLKDVKEKKLMDYVKEAVKMNASGKIDMKAVVEKQERKIEIPADLKKWLSANKKAKTFFETLPFTSKKEIALALTGAKQEETRKRRFLKITTALKAGKRLS
jgi:hypothetical protein